MTEEPPSDAPAQHLPEIVERGSFCTARCGCGWSAAARRSRDRARRDLAAHLELTAALATDQGVSTVLPAGEPSAER